MKEYLRRALFDALSELGEQNRHLVIFHIQKYCGIRFTMGHCPSVAEIESALGQTLGVTAERFIKKFEKELERYSLPLRMGFLEPVDKLESRIDSEGLRANPVISNAGQKIRN